MTRRNGSHRLLDEMRARASILAAACLGAALLPAWALASGLPQDLIAFSREGYSGSRDLPHGQRGLVELACSYSSPCIFPDPPATGFAVWMRFRSMSAARVQGAPFNATPFNTFKAQVKGLEGIYDANTSDTFARTLCANKSRGMYSETDFWASVMMKLASLYCGQRFV